MSDRLWGQTIGKRFRAGVVGVGARTVHGEGWARTLAAMPQVDLVRLVDEERTAVENSSRALAVADWSTDPRAVLEADDLDFVIVNSIDGLHAQHVNLALDSGKHVVTDKPLAVSTADAGQIAAKAKRRGLKVAVGHNFRFAPHYEFLKGRVDSGDLGKLFQVEAGYVHDLRRIWKLTPWRADPSDPQNPWFGGVTHPVDLARWIGGEVVEVMAVENKGCSPQEYLPPDNFILVLKFESGAVGRIWCTFCIRQNPEFQTFCNAFGDKGSCLANLQRNRVEYHPDWRIPESGGPLEIPFPAHPDINRALIEDFLAAVESGGSPRGDAAEAVRTMSVIDAAVKSVGSGRFESVLDGGDGRH